MLDVILDVIIKICCFGLGFCCLGLAACYFLLLALLSKEKKRDD